jgi:hemolysin activation/secretion protein
LYRIKPDSSYIDAPCFLTERTPAKGGLVRLGVLLAITASFGISHDKALGQAAGSPPVSPVTVTPPTLAPEGPSSGFAVDIPDAGALQPPPGADALSITLGDVAVEGAFPELSEQIDVILAKVRNRRVSLSEIYAAASEVEAAHARSGFVLARVSVPPQQLVDGGTLRLLVADGFIESVDTSALPNEIRDATAQRVASLEGKRRVTLEDIEEALSIAADLPGLSLRSTLMRGSQPSSAKLVLEGDQQMVSGSIGVDNQLDPSLGRWGLNLQMVVNSALGLGEQIYGFASSDYDVSDFFSGEPKERVLGGGVILPFGSGRLSLNPEVTFATTTPEAELGVLRTRGQLRRLSLRGQAIVSKGRRQDARLGLTAEQVDVRNDALDFASRLNHDRYVALRFSGTLSKTGVDGTRVGFNLQLSQGLGGFGGITASEALRSRTPFSRIGSTPNFTKLAATGRVAVPLDEKFQFSFMGSAQTSFGKPVFRSEQFSLEGADGLSAYLGGRTAVDAGIVGRGELSFVSSLSAESGSSTTVAPYVFAAFGAGRLEAPTAVERSSIRALNYGAGMRAKLFNKLDLRFEYARSASHIAALDEVDRLNVSAAFQF